LHQHADDERLDELNLVIPTTRAGQSIKVDYFATAKDTRGRFTDSFEVGVVPELLPVAVLLDTTEGG
jgi:hypothetical protein